MKLFSKASGFFPKSVPYQPVLENLKLLEHYRNSTVHFYSEPGLSAVLYSLAQTCIVNYKDLVLDVFGQDITEEITLTLLPLGFGSPPDPIVFLRKKTEEPSKNRILDEFITEIVDSTRNLQEKNLDTGRFLTPFSVSLKSVKKISVADIVVGIDGTANGNSSTIVVQRDVDSNERYPLKRKDVLEKIGNTLKGVIFNQHVLNTIIFKYNCKQNTDYIWKALGGGSMQYSYVFVNFVKGLSKTELEDALASYKNRKKSGRP